MWAWPKMGDGAEIDAGFKQVDRGAVAQAVGMDAFAFELGWRSAVRWKWRLRMSRTPKRVRGVPCRFRNTG